MRNPRWAASAAGHVRGKRAISPIVATVLIVAVTLVGSVAVAGFVFGVFGTSTNSAEVAVTGGDLRSADFLSTNSGKTFTCGNFVGSFLTITNTGTSGTAVTAATITWAGQVTTFTLAAGSTCTVGASGSSTATQNLLFSASSLLTVSARGGGTFTGSVILGTGAVLLYTGVFQ